MNLKKMFFSSLIFSFLMLNQFSIAQHGHTKNKDAVGKIDFPVSDNAEVQDQFNHALAMLHHMMYDHAEKEFKKIAEQEPHCAMAYWGIAMSHFHPLWHEPGKEDLKKGWEAIEKAGELTAEKKQKDYISAIEAFYKNWETAKHAERLANWENAQETLHQAYPDDTDAGAFYALSLITTAPKDDKTFSNQKKAGALLEELFVKAPEHPGLFHYIIHAYDNPLLAKNAVEIARGYDKLAPNVPHALHMPSHIFVRLGLWDDAIDWNTRSAAAALENSLNGVVSIHYPHALDYLMYSYLQQANDKMSADVLSKINKDENYEDNVAAAYGIAAAQARFFLEQRQWLSASKLPVRLHSKFPWDKYPWTEAITYFARGLGSARINDLTAAKDAVTMLDKLYESTMKAGQNYWAIQVDVQSKTVAAWIAYSEGKKEEALTLMKKAADLEDSVDKHPVTPGAVLPARELYGDMLLLSGKPNDALTAYASALEISPNRFNSLYGAGNAAQLAGDLNKAKSYYSELMKLTNGTESERTEIKEVTSFMANK